MFPQAEWKPEQWENVFSRKQKMYAKQKYFLKTLRGQGCGGVERMGRRQGKSMKEKKKNSKIWNEVWSGFNLHQLANKSMKAVLGMDIPSVM